MARRRLIWFVQTESGLMLIRIATQRHAHAIARSIGRPGGAECGFECAGAAHGANGVLTVSGLLYQRNLSLMDLSLTILRQWTRHMPDVLDKIKTAQRMIGEK